MNIKLQSITLHHFLSFDESTIDLSDRGFCLVSGVNRNPKDAAKSNGSGKSTIFNAISFVLTGETLQGLKTNLGNIYYNDGCWVSLNLTIDGHEYTLLRSRDDKKYGTNLKITVDGEDRSGKGIRESEEILAELLPDVTSELIGSVILIGQGMPQKFTNNSPAKRKEILEHLSKSDFMIQDLKDRVEQRSIKLSQDLRKQEDSIISLSSQKDVYNRQLEAANTELTEASKTVNYEEEYNVHKIAYESYETQLKQLEGKITVKDEEYKGISLEFTNLYNKRQKALDQVRAQHDEAVKEFNKERGELTSQIYALKMEIERLKSVKDVCPTCGQKIPGAIKPDTSVQEGKLTALNEALKKLDEEIALDNQDFANALDSIRTEFDDNISAKQKEMTTASTELTTLNGEKNRLSNLMLGENSAMTKIKTLQENHESNLARINKNIKEFSDKIKELGDELKVASDAKEELNKHLEVISKMNTFLKRDFRGFLLEDIINFISAKAKEYCSQIFGSDEIVFALNSNNIDIEYCGKDYDNLSGGEKQRVDLIIQFAIRSLLVNYLGFNSNILVLDEITDNLDSISCDKVLNFITKELSTIESVFIISHHASELEIPCDSEIIVEKNQEGVSHAI